MKMTIIKINDIKFCSKLYTQFPVCNLDVVILQGIGWSHDRLTRLIQWAFPFFTIIGTIKHWIMTKELEKKVNQAIKLLQSIPQDKGDVELCYSGGKDSDVILELAKMAEIKFRPIYKNTTIDPIGTIKHCKEKGVEIVNPSITFFKLMQKKGYPSRFCRFCCEKLKEYKICDIAIQGIRKSESLKRNNLYNEPQICRFYGNKKNRVSVFLPILNWTDEDVSEFVSERNIECHPIYYRGGAI